MATLSAALLNGVDKNIPKSKRKLQKHLRSAGLAYISRTGKLIPAKKVAEELCQCPQKCDERVPMEVRQRLFSHFYGLGDTDQQNKFLRQHMDVRARNNHVPEAVATIASATGRSPRRITCKYLLPLLPTEDTVEVCQKAFVSAFVITTKRVRLQREKLISSLGLNSYSHTRAPKSSSTAASSSLSSSHEDNQSTDSNYSVLYECDMSRTDANSREAPGKDGGNNNGKDPPTKRSTVEMDNPLIPMGLLLPEGITIAPVIAYPDQERDMAIVNNFFSNQLWKPEYIGTYS